MHAPLENVELLIEGNIDSADFISNAMETIERYYKVSIMMYLYFYILLVNLFFS